MHAATRGFRVQGRNDGREGGRKDGGGIGILEEDGGARVGDVLNMKAELGIGSRRVRVRDVRAVD